jgi:1-acyl-sn-glycerol-3-phosphate acyltransferase
MSASRVVTGIHNFPMQGPGLIVINHLGDADGILLLAVLPRFFEALAKIDLYRYPILGILMDAFGVIWVHRGVADRNAVKACLSAFEHNRLVAIAPEARESLTGALEKGTSGAAYMALKGNVPIIPITVTGTENKRIVANLRRLRKNRFTVTIGKPFSLQTNPDVRQGVKDGTKTIMMTLAEQLPPEYRGVYANAEADAAAEESGM